MQYTQSVAPVEIINIQDPVTWLNQPVHYNIHRGGTGIRYNIVPSTSYSSTGANFDILIPNNTIVDRNISIQMPITIDFVGTAPPGQNLLQTGYDAFRAFPIANITSVMTVEINGLAYTQENYKLIPYLTHINGFNEATEFSMSTTPHYLDCSQSYDDLVNTIRNPLGGYGDSVDKTNTPRGAFPYDTIVNTPTTARITATLVEPLFVSPLAWGEDTQKGLYYLDRIAVKIIWRGDLSRVWSHSTAGGSVFSVNPVVTLGQPQLNMRYITPTAIEPRPPPPVQYGFKQLLLHPAYTNMTLLAGASTTINMAALQLSTVPDRAFIFARKRDADLTYLDADVFAAIDSVNMSIDTTNGILSSATSSDLYQIARQNLVTMSYESWSGKPIRTMIGGGATTTYAGCGSILPLVFGKDIPLEDGIVPGVRQVIQINGEFRFRNPSNDTVTYDVFFWYQHSGIWDIFPGTSNQATGIITKEAAITARTANPTVVVNNYRALAVGGSFFGDLWSGFKNVASKVGNAIQDVVPFVTGTVLPTVNAVRGLIGKGLNTPYIEEIDDDDDNISVQSGMSGRSLRSEGGRLMSRQRLMARRDKL